MTVDTAPNDRTLASRFVDSMKWNLMIQVFGLGIRLLSSLVIARGLGVRLYGVNASMNSLFALLPSLLSIGFEQTIQVLASRWMASSENRPQVRTLIGRLVAWRLALYGLAGVVLFFAAPAIAEWVREPEVAFFVRLLSATMLVSGIGSIYGNFAQACLRIRGLTLYNMGLQVAGLVAAFLILRAGGGIAALLEWQLAAAVVSLGFYAVNAHRLMPGAKEPIEVRPVLRFAGVAWLTALCGQFLLKELDVVLLNVFHVAWQQIGAYNLGASLGITMGLLTHGMGPLFQSALAETAQSSDEAQVGKVWQIAIKAEAVFTVPPFFFVFSFAPAIVVGFYGAEFQDSAWIFQAMAVPQLVYALLGLSFSAPLFFAMGRGRLALGFRVLAGCANLVLDLLLIPLYGVLGAVIATSLAIIGVAVAEMSVVHRMTGAWPPVRFLIKWLGCFVIASLGAAVVPGTGWPLWGGRLAVYVVLALALLRVVRPLEAEERAFLARHVPAARRVFENL